MDFVMLSCPINPYQKLEECNYDEKQTKKDHVKSASERKYFEVTSVNSNKKIG